MISNLLLLALGGALGTLSRAGLSTLVQRFTNPDFPWGTLAVNLLGCFLFGLVWAVLEAQVEAQPQVRVVLLTVFMGSFTTFSTFVFDAQHLAASARYGAFVSNLLLQNAVGLACLIGGMSLGRAVS